MIEHPTISKSGFIAQELKEILPEFVNGTESENEYLGIDYNGILALAVKAIQELKGEIDILAALMTLHYNHRHYSSNILESLLLVYLHQDFLLLSRISLGLLHILESLDQRYTVEKSQHQ